MAAAIGGPFATRPASTQSTADEGELFGPHGASIWVVTTPEKSLATCRPVSSAQRAAKSRAASQKTSAFAVHADGRVLEREDLREDVVLGEVPGVVERVAGDVIVGSARGQGSP